MRERGKIWDGDLQMFREEPRGPNLGRLGFLRWLAEQGKLEHGIAGPSGGEYAGDVAGAGHIGAD